MIDFKPRSFLCLEVNGTGVKNLKFSRRLNSEHFNLWMFLGFFDNTAILEKTQGTTTPPLRRDRAAYLASDAGKAWYKQRGTSIEPFFATIKDRFDLDPLPVQGKTKASAFILLALYAWNLIVLFNFLNDRPLGVVKPILDAL